MTQSDFIKHLSSRLKENRDKFGWTDTDQVDALIEAEGWIGKDRTLKNLLDNL